MFPENKLIDWNEIDNFKSEVKFHLWDYWGHLEAATASETAQKVIIGNIHINTMVIEVADFKS